MANYNVTIEHQGIKGFQRIADHFGVSRPTLQRHYHRHGDIERAIRTAKDTKYRRAKAKPVIKAKPQIDPLMRLALGISKPRKLSANEKLIESLLKQLPSIDEVAHAMGEGNSGGVVYWKKRIIELVENGDIKL